MSLKKEILQKYNQILQDKIDVFRDMIANLSLDAQNDAKGSAGDKHETALAMMHLEQEKLNYKLKEILDQKNILDKIDPNSIHQNIAIGSIVHANNWIFFVATALPKITIENKTIIALSPQSPLGSKLIGKTVGFSFDINTSNYIIDKIQ